MSNTTEMRDAWASNLCGRMPAGKFKFWDGTTININLRAAQAYQALDDILRAYAYHVRQADTGAYNCRQITGGAGYSLHAYGIAVDINWLTNPYQLLSRWQRYGVITDMPAAMVQKIKSIRTVDNELVWRWGGDYTGNKDTMHFELQATPAQLARGIRNTITPTPNPIGPGNPDVTDPIKEKIEMIAAFITNRDGHAEYLAVDPTTTTVENVWQDKEGNLHHTAMSTTLVDGKPVTIKGIEHLESHYDEDSHTNIVRAVGFMLSPWILFRHEDEPGQYKWGNWIAWAEWAKFVQSLPPK